LADIVLTHSCEILFAHIFWQFTIFSGVFSRRSNFSDPQTSKRKTLYDVVSSEGNGWCTERWRGRMKAEEEILAEKIHGVNTHTQVDLDRTDVLDALDKLEEQEEQERDHEFARVTRQIQNKGIKGIELVGRLPGVLETKRERMLYRTFMEIVRTQQQQLAGYQQQLEAKNRELAMLKQAFQTIVGEEIRVFDESKIAA
jgi:hypothetical protein